MLRIIQGDITKVRLEVDYIVNASNGIGLMPGGVAGAIRKAGGRSIELEAIIKCLMEKSSPGNLFVTRAGRFPFKGIIHLITMKFPGTKSKPETIEKCLHSLINYCKENDIKKVALPALGTGVGGLNKKKVVQLYKQILEPITEVEYIVVSTDEEFIHNFF